MNQRETVAQIWADSARQAIAYIRALKEDNADDQVVILKGVTCAPWFAMFLADIAVTQGDFPEEWFSVAVNTVNEMELSGDFLKRLEMIPEDMLKGLLGEDPEDPEESP